MDSKSWSRLSIRRKVMYWLCAVVLVMAGLVILTDAARQQTMRELDRLQQNDTLCYTVQAALDTERRTFEDLFREPSRANQAAFSEACVATEAAIGALPFDYGEIGQERYARTWNLRSGYAGYRNFREEILNMDPAAEDYSARFYRAVEMLDDLSVYEITVTASLRHVFHDEFAHQGIIHSCKEFLDRRIITLFANGHDNLVALFPFFIHFQNQF